MIKYFDGTVFNAPVNTFVNAVNTVGVMGAGIALEFSLRYPELLENYRRKCEKKEIQLGKMDYFVTYDNVSIINFPTKGHFKYPSRLSWIEEGLKDFVNTYKDNNITSVAFPKLGCSNGGLDWQDVKDVMERYLNDVDIDVYICLDTKREAQGKEKEMLDRINSISLYKLQQELGLNEKQCIEIEKAKPISRFWHIGKIDKISSKAYKKLFDYFYNYSQKNEQISLFDEFDI